MNSQKLILAGGSGFLGRVLSRYFQTRGWRVCILSRTPAPTPSPANDETCCEHYWDGCRLGDWVDQLEGATAVINLAGRSVDCRYHERNRKLMMDSRVQSTRILGEAIRRCTKPPQVWLNSSTATIYKHSFEQPMDESGALGATPEAKDAYSIEVATAWEEAFSAAVVPGTRKVVLRTAMVLGPDAGVFPVLCRLTRFGLGGPMASGKQYVSWIHEVDFCRAIEWLIGHENFEGVVNLAAPGPVPNREMMSIFRQACGVSFGLPAAAWMLELGAFFIRTETELIIKSRRVVPGRLRAVGFEFRFCEFSQAVQDLLHRQSVIAAELTQERGAVSS